MKRFFLSVMILSLALWVWASENFDVQYDKPQEGIYHLEFSLGTFDISAVELGGTSFNAIRFGGGVTTNRKGFAELPFIHASVMIGAEKNVHAVVIPGEYEDIQLEHPLLPSRGVIYRDQDPSTIPYLVDPKSMTDEWYPSELAVSTEPYILRDIRGTNVYVYPFRYNAVQNVLRVYKSVTVKLVENDTPALNPLQKVPQTVLREMDAIYRDVFINYEVTASRDDLTVGEVGDILVITTDRDQAAIQPYIDWKTEKGYFVDMEVVTTGTNVNSLVQDAYDANNNLLYVLLVGDWADIKCNTLSGSYPMDPQVGCVVGTDDYPDITVGRFSSNSPNDVTVQVNKVISYEKLPEMGASWYSSATGIASAEGAGIGDDGESDIQHNNVIWNDKLDPFTFDLFTDIYDPGASASEVTTIVNSGTSIINYTGHGSMTSWGTTGFSNNHVSNLSNGERMPWIISVACNNGDFHNGTCFAEAWLRKENGGAIMMMAASISQPWDPPMRGQDYMNDVMIGGYDYTSHSGQNGISTTEQRTTFGAIAFNGLVLMCVESGSGSDWETAKTWNLFGDPATQVRTTAPADLTMSGSVVMVGIPFATTITTNEGPVENAMVALSQGELMFRGFTDASGTVTIEHTLNPGTAKLVVTGFNTETIYEDVTVVPASGPYVMFSSFEIDDAEGNGNGMLDYHETAYLTVGLTNVGSEEATNVQAVLATGDAFITLTDTSASFGTLAAGDTVQVTNAFQLTVADSIPDGHVVIFMLDITGNGDQAWTSSFGTQAHAPQLMFVDFTVVDTAGNANGRLDPGETADLTVTVKNGGSSAAFNVLGELICENTNITIGSGPATFGDMGVADTRTFTFQVEVSPEAQQGELAAFSLEILADYNIMGSGAFELYIGQIPVLLVDLDGNHNSMEAIAQCLENLQVGSDAFDAFPANLNLYSSVFVCLGTYPDNHVLTEEEGQFLAEYLEGGGQVYMEGADTWYYDPQTPVHALFGIRGESDGSGDLATIQGMDGSMAEGMQFVYSGDNSYIDHIIADGGTTMFENLSPEYGTGISYDAGTYRTIGFSMEFGGLADGDHSKDELMIHILEFFGIQGVWTSINDREYPDISATVYPNPVRDEMTVRFVNKKDARMNLSLFNLSGQMVGGLMDEELPQGIHQFTWSMGDAGIAPGVYFLRIMAEDEVTVKKVIVAR